MNFERLRYVAERTAVGEKREMLLAVTLPEAPGALLKFCGLLGQAWHHRIQLSLLSGRRCAYFRGRTAAGLRRGRQGRSGKTKSHGFPVIDLTGNELAKEHVRYMVGGHPPKLIGEVLYRFEFPERPGALLKFLRR